MSARTSHHDCHLFAALPPPKDQRVYTGVNAMNMFFLPFKVLDKFSMPLADVLEALYRRHGKEKVEEARKMLPVSR